MKVIFLDIDGVLNVGFNGKDEYGHLFYPEFVDNLARIVRETGAKIVISSTWRKAGLDVMREMWQKRNLPSGVFGITAVLPDRIRGNEIDVSIDYINQVKERIDRYVILDDDTDMLDSQLPYFLQCSELKDPDAVHGYGLTKRIAERAIEILNS